MVPNDRKRARGGTVAEIVRLDFHDFFGRLIDRIKGKTTEKNKGVIMLEKIEQGFGISERDREKFREEMLEEQKEAIQASPRRLKEKKIAWTRDGEGKLISPFKSKKLNK